MSIEISDSALKKVALYSIALICLLIGIKYVIQQFDIDLGHTNALAEYYLQIIFGAIAILASGILAFKGFIKEGFLLLIISVCFTVLTGENLDLLLTIVMVAGVIACVVELIREGSMLLAGLGIVFVICKIVEVITINLWIDFFSDNVILIAILTFATMAVAFLAAYQDGEEEDSGYHY
jgi:hypothetical protein